jgi:tetrahydromethanopterin S-methyltransferase subunit G
MIESHEKLLRLTKSKLPQLEELWQEHVSEELARELGKEIGRDTGLNEKFISIVRSGTGCGD